MAEPRPSLTESGSDGARLLVAAARRYGHAARQLKVPEALRLSDWQRRIVATLIEGLTRTVEDELRAALATRFTTPEEEPLRATLSSAHVELAGPMVDRAGLWSDPQMLALLLRRAEEYRTYRSGSLVGDPLPSLIRDADAGIAAAAMAVLIGRSRRLDRVEEPLVARTELPAELQHRLVWTVAAGLRVYMVEQHGIAPAQADEALAEEAGLLLADYDEGDTLEARSMRLAQALADAGRLEDRLLLDALSAGSLPLFLAGISLRARIGLADAWDIVSDIDGRGSPLLLRAAGVERQPAAAMLLALARDEAALGPQLDLFDTIGEEGAREALRLWRVDPAYRAALAGMLAETLP